MQMSSRSFAQLGKFLSVGALNTLIGLLAIYAAKWFFGIGDIAANAVGYSIGLLISFTLNSRWTFAYQGARLAALLKFLLVTLFAYSMNLVVVLIAIRHLDLNAYVAQALGIPPYTLTLFLASKYLVFRSEPEKNEQP
jgi:putative flippase GtrA